MRSIRTAALVLSALVAAACSDNRLPTDPITASGAPPASNSLAITGQCVDVTLKLFRDLNTPANELTVDEEIKLLIAGSATFGPGLFVGDNRQSALTMWENLKKDKLDSRPLQSHINNEANFTLSQLGIGGIQDPDGGGLFNAVTGSIRVLDLIFRCTGTTPTSLPEPPAGFNAEWEIVHQQVSTIIQQFTTTGGDVAVAFDGDALPDGTLLVIVGAQPADVQVNTPFPKLSNTVDVAVAGGRPTKNLSVLVCPSPLIQHVVNHRAVIAHQFAPAPAGSPVGQGVEYLAPAERGNLTCPENVASHWSKEKGFFRQRVAQLATIAQKAWSFVGPKPLYAAHAAIGGITDLGRLSPMVAVDPFVETAITDVIIPETTYGQAIVFTATLRVSAGPAAWVGQPLTASLPGMPLPLTLAALQITTTLSDGKTQTDAIDETGVAHFSFSEVNAGDHTADLAFPTTLNLPANAPLFGGSSLQDVPFHVNQAPLDVVPANATKTYGDANPALTGEVQGLQYDDAITATYATTATQESFISTTDRTYPITAASVAAGAGTLLSNYVYDLAEHTALLSITRRTLGGNAANASRMYGEANPAFTGTVTNQVPAPFNDGLTISYVNSSVATTGVGPGEPIADAYLIRSVLGGANGVAENYVDNIGDGTLTITHRVLSGGPTQPAADVMYGEAIPTSFPGALNVAGGTGNALVPGDGVTASFVTSAVQGNFVGNYPIALQLLGAAASNYNVVGVAAGVFAITQRPLSVTANNASREYGEANPTPFSGVVVGRYAGDDLTIDYSTTADPTTPVGTNAAPIVPTIGGAAASSYLVTLNNGFLTITRAPLDITANPATRAFGDPSPATFTGSAVGAKNGETIVVIAVAQVEITETTPAGEYLLIPFLSGSYPNYVVRNTSSGTLTITPAQPPGLGTASSTR